MGIYKKIIKINFAFNFFFLGLTFVYSQKQCNIDSLIKINGVYEIIGNKKLTGLISIYDLKNYKKRFLGNLLDGKKEGTWREFHPNNRILVENYNNGKLDGSVSLFYKNGQKEWRYNYTNGVLNGSYSKWYSNGQKATNGYFENGKPVGIWAWWDKNGTITKKKNYLQKTNGITKGHNQYTYKVDVIK